VATTRIYGAGAEQPAPDVDLTFTSAAMPSVSWGDYVMHRLNCRLDSQMNEYGWWYFLYQSVPLSQDPHQYAKILNFDTCGYGNNVVAFGMGVESVEHLLDNCFILSADLSGNQIVDIGAIDTDAMNTALATLNLADNLLTQASVDAILHALANHSAVTGGTLNLSSTGAYPAGNAAPSATGWADYDTLTDPEGRNWYVFVNGEHPS
jgi:hypothetical protein